MLKALWTYDTYERHAMAERLLCPFPVRSVLDVGGIASSLKPFTRASVTALNVDGSGEVTYDGEHIPFGSGTFDAVITLDTLEHIPREKRRAFVQECWRVARSVVIIAAPLGSEGHCAYERRLDELYRRVHGSSYRFLSEHVTCGLPSLEEVNALAKTVPAGTSEILFAGDYRWQCRQFEKRLLLQGRTGVGAAIERLILRIGLRAFLHPISPRREPTEWTNRFYLTLVKDGA